MRKGTAFNKCECCGNWVPKGQYAPGFRKCFECIDRIKYLRNDFGLKVSCLKIIYGPI